MFKLLHIIQGWIPAFVGMTGGKRGKTPYVRKGRYGSTFHALSGVWWSLLVLLGLLNVSTTAHAAFPVWTYPPHSQQPIQVEGVDTPMGLAIAFDSKNRPYFLADRTGTLTGKIRTLRNGLWHDIDYSTADWTGFAEKAAMLSMRLRGLLAHGACCIRPILPYLPQFSIPTIFPFLLTSKKT